MPGAHLLWHIVQIILRNGCPGDLLPSRVIRGQSRDVLILLQQMLIVVLRDLLQFIIHIVFQRSEVQGITIILGLHILPLHIDPRHGQRCQYKG